jgi:Arc/MetJ-type ribon-helix-helix transcriptional regulator
MAQWYIHFMSQNIATTPQIDQLVASWVAEGRFANRSEAFRAGVFALKEKFEAEGFDPDFAAIIRELDRHPGGEGELTAKDLREIARIARKHRRRE